MFNLNTVLLAGNLTRDPELKELPGGGAVASFGVATSRRIKKNDSWENTPEYHNIVTFGKQAESVAAFLKKGDGCFIEGRIQTRSWEKDGKKEYRTEIVAESVQFGPKEKREKPVTPTPTDIWPE